MMSQLSVDDVWIETLERLPPNLTEVSGQALFKLLQLLTGGKGNSPQQLSHVAVFVIEELVDWSGTEDLFFAQETQQEEVVENPKEELVEIALEHEMGLFLMDDSVTQEEWSFGMCFFTDEKLQEDSREVVELGCRLDEFLESLSLLVHDMEFPRFQKVLTLAQYFFKKLFSSQNAIVVPILHLRVFPLRLEGSKSEI